MPRKLVYFIFLLLPLGCINPEICCTNISTDISIIYQNQAGENLFEIADGLDVNRIITYIKEDGEWVYYHGGGSDAPRGLVLQEEQGETYLVLYPSHTTDAEGYSEMKLIFSPTDSDSLRVKIESVKNNTYKTEVWYNNELKWDLNRTTEPFVVVK